MPINFTNIRTINLVLDFLQERLAYGDTVAFVQKMTQLQVELEAWSLAINDTANDMNTVAAEFTAYEVNSAYDLAVENGFVGSVEQYLASLVGVDGAPGVDGIDGINGFDGLDGLDGLNGLNGLDGLDGLQGPPGPAGLTSGIQGIAGPSGLPGDGPYAVPVYSQLDPVDIAALVPGDRVQLDDGRIVALGDDAARDYLGSFADALALDALDPRYGDYVKLADDGGQYYYYDSTAGGGAGAWIDTNSTSVPVVPSSPLISPNPEPYTFLGVVADIAARDALTPANGDYALVTADGGQYHYWDASASGGAGGWVDTGVTTVPQYPTVKTYLGEVADTTARDALSPSHGDYVAVIADAEQFHYYDATLSGGAGGWVDTGSTVVPTVPGVRAAGAQSSWQTESNLPRVSTAAELDGLDWGAYPQGVLVEDTGEVFYRNDDKNRVFHDLEGTAAAFGSGGEVAGAALAGQAVRVQVQITADTHARVLLDTGANSFGVEITATGLQPRDSGAPVGQGQAVSVGDIIGLYRLSNGVAAINVNGRDVYTFARTDTAAMKIGATLADVGDWLRFTESGTGGTTLTPVRWDVGTLTATLHEVDLSGTEWSTVPAAVQNALAAPDAATGGAALLRVYERAAGQRPVLGGNPNVYPDGATVDTGGLVNGDLFTILIAPGTGNVISGPGVFSVDAAKYNRHEPFHFAVIGGSLKWIAGNILYS